MRTYISLFLLVALLLVAFIFGSQNNQILSLNYLIARTDISVAAAVSLFTLIGFFLGIITAYIFRVSRKFKNSSSPKS